MRSPALISIGRDCGTAATNAIQAKRIMTRFFKYFLYKRTSVSVPSARSDGTDKQDSFGSYINLSKLKSKHKLNPTRSASTGCTGVHNVLDHTKVIIAEMGS